MHSEGVGGMFLLSPLSYFLFNAPMNPSFPRDDVLTALQDKQVLVISGDTGCGKSTQVGWECCGVKLKLVECFEMAKLK